MSEAGHVKPLPQLQLNVARQESGLNIARVHVLFFSFSRQIRHSDLYYVILPSFKC